jgi:UDP-2,3-diacylglucosamine pyrophosphatase LpxH
MSKSKIIVLSDIHIGTNKPTVWYQKDFHEPYLKTVLNYVIQHADSILELLLLGDIVDFWTYPPDEQPPSFSDIIAANPNIFGLNGKLSEVLTALDGNVTYVRGNHDMNITQGDLNKIQNSKGYKIKLASDDIYYPLGNGNKRIACTHGNIFTMFNAPDTSTKFNPLPVGQFVTRAVAYQQKRTLKPGQTVADLPNQGAPNGISISDLIQALPQLPTKTFAVTELLLNYISDVTHMPLDQPIILPDDQTITLAEAKQLYGALWKQWVTQYGGDIDGFLAAIKAAIADANGYYMGWFAQKLALECGADLVVMGHTHTPISGLEKALIQYVNSGFECPSKPDIGKQYPTFTEIDTEQCQASVFKVVNNNGSYQIKAYEAEQASVIIPGLSEDYSCYLIVDNTNGSSELQLVNYSATQGYYVVAPPERILPGERGRFWIQDYPAGINPRNLVKGSEGKVTYSGGGRQITLTYACPVGFWNSNKCSGSNFYTSTDGRNWGNLNQIPDFGFGHPFFVRFIP